MALVDSHGTMTLSLTANMGPNPLANPELSNFSIAGQNSAIAIPPTSSPTSEMPSVFNIGQNSNTLITGGSFYFTTNSTIITGQPLDVLFKRVAPNAILNDGGRADEVRCHPGTREEVIGRIEKWGNAQDCQISPMFWLSGPAGAGKSAIVQTLAERCDQRGIPHANFFFFRADTSRSTAAPLIATLVYQIITLYPCLRDLITTPLAADPLILDSALEHQLARLIITPLRSLERSSSGHCSLLILIDGLDECDSTSKRDQQRILRAFDTVLAEPSCPFRLFIASRDESQICAAFNKMASECTRIFLNDEYRPEHDIRMFVNAQFEQVKQAHPLAHTLDSIWPAIEDINYIVKKSSGQFIYAATVMRFILDSAASPPVSLERVKGAAQLATKLPFCHLDAIYTYILSQADDQEGLQDILGADCSIKSVSNAIYKTLQSRRRSTIPLLELLRFVNQRYSDGVILSCLADITPIARYDPDSKELLFYHASFSDYLLDHSRSREYFVDMATFHYKILPVVWRHLIDHGYQSAWLQFGLLGMTHLHKLPPHLMNTVALTDFKVNFGCHPGKIDIFEIVYKLCDCDDDIKCFRPFFYNWINDVVVNGPHFSGYETVLNNIKQNPFGLRYYYMAKANRGNIPDSEMFTALRPTTNFDRHESSLWLRDSIFSCYRNKWPDDTEGYKQLLKSWIPWAVENDIPCGVFGDLPYARQYIRRSIMKKWVEKLKFNIGRSRK